MFKMSLAVVRHPDLTHEQFLSYWIGQHAPLVRRLAQDLRIRRYVQLHGEAGEVASLFARSRGLDQLTDGVAELWWDSERDRLEAAHSEAGIYASAQLREDEARFCDLARCTASFGQEHVIIGDLQGR